MEMWHSLNFFIKLVILACYQVQPPTEFIRGVVSCYYIYYVYDVFIIIIIIIIVIIMTTMIAVALNKASEFSLLCIIFFKNR